MNSADKDSFPEGPQQISVSENPKNFRMTLLNTLYEKESPKVNIASVANPSDVNYFNNIINGIDNAVVTNSNAPEVFLLTSQFFAPFRTRICRQRLYFWENALDFFLR